ncbi:MAG: protein kinase [Candidatus Omnitrophica bacterium]|nr:protein kinase [Candidatus Omnitrophota bacterium]
MKRKFCLKFCALFVTCLFTVNVTSPKTAFSESVEISQSESQLFSGLSQNVCDVEELWFSPAQNAKPLGFEPLVILLQEAHVNYGAQKNIVATLEYFQKKFKTLGLPENVTIALEGNPAMKEIDPVIFRAFPQPKVTRKVTDSFMRDGKIDGAEFYAINSNPNARLFGIDDPALYQKNLQAFKLFRADQENVKSDLKQIRAEVERLKEKVYAKPLKDLEESRKRFGRDTASLRLHLRVLAGAAKLKNFSITDYPLVLAMQNLFDQETTLAPKSLEEKMRAIRSYEFFDQMSRLEENLYEELAFSRDEKLLVSVDRYLALLEKLVEFSLTQNDYKHLENSWRSISDSEAWKSLDDLSRRRNSHFQSWNLISGLLKPLEVAKEFYQSAKERDSALIQNLEKLINVTGQKIIFVVAGGFHMEGMTSRLRSDGISYIALTPMANPDEGNSLYWSRLSGARSEIQNLLAQTSTVKPKSLQDDSEFQQEAAITLLAATANSLGVNNPDDEEKMFLGYLKQYVQRLRGLQGNLPVSEGAKFLEQMLEQFNKLREARPAGSVPIQIGNETYDFYVRSLLVPDTQGRSVQIGETHFQLAAIPRRHKTQVLTSTVPAEPVARPPLKPWDYLKERFKEKGYTLVKKLGQGGMGVVYEAVEEGTGRKVAIKMIRPDIQDFEDRDIVRFKREGEALAKFSHPNVVTVHASGEVQISDSESRPYYVMAFLPYPDMRKQIAAWRNGGKIVANSTQNIEFFVTLMQTVARAVDHVNGQGIVHRDLKPENIIMQDEATPIVTDFGLILNQEEKDRLSKTGEIAGTANYMSPEQSDFAAQKKKDDIDRRTDLWALAVILYELLTDKKPFDAASQLGVLAKIAGENPASPSSINSLIPPALDNIILKALEKERENRYQTAGEFADALQSFLTGEAEAKRKRDERRALLKIGGVGLLALAFGGAGLAVKIASDRAAAKKRLKDAEGQISEVRKQIDAVVTATAGRQLDAADSALKTAEKLINDLNTDLVPQITDAKGALLEQLQILRGFLSAINEVNSGVATNKTGAIFQDLLNATQIPESLKMISRIFLVRLKLRSSQPDYAQVHALLNTLFVSINNMPEPWQKEVGKIPDELLSRLVIELDLTGINAEIFHNMLRLFKVFAASELFEAPVINKAEFFARLGYLLNRPGLYRDLSGATEAFQNSNRLLEQLNTPESQFLKAQNLIDLGIVQFGVVHFAYGKIMDADTRDQALVAVQKAGVYFDNSRDLMNRLAAQTPDVSIRLKARKVMMDAYVIQMALQVVELRKVLEDRPKQFRGAFYNNLRKMTGPPTNEDKAEGAQPLSDKIIKFYEDMISNEVLLRTQMGSLDAQLGNPANEETAARLQNTIEFEIDKALFQELLIRLNQNRQLVDNNIADKKFQNLWSLKNQVGGERAERVQPYLNMSGIMIGQMSKAGTPLEEFAGALLARREFIRKGELNDPDLVSKFQQSAGVLGPTTYGRLAGVLSVEGKSLGAAKDIFDAVEEEKRLSPVIMEFSEVVLRQLIDRRSDLRQGNKSLPVFFLVRDASELRRISKEYPGLWRDYRIGLLGWKFAPMSKMKFGDVVTLMKLGHLKIYLRSLFPEGEVTELRPDQVVFVNDAFGPKWEEGTRRVKFDRNRFDNDEEYRSAYLASAFYLVTHGKGEGIFQYNATDQIFELLPTILTNLMNAWKALKEVLVAA